MEQKILVSPVKRYAPPKYPSLDEAGRDPELLRKLPPRWRNNAKVVAAVGMLGAMTLTSCGVKDFILTKPTPTILETPEIPWGCVAVVRSVYLTEQEALAVIVGMMESEGLNLEPLSSEHSTAIKGTVKDMNFDDKEIDLRLYDFEKQVGVTYLSEEEFNKLFPKEPFDRYRSDKIRDTEFPLMLVIPGESTEEDSEEQEADIAAGVFRDRYEYYDSWQFGEEYLREQVRDFIEWLQGQGII